MSKLEWKTFSVTEKVIEEFLNKKYDNNGVIMVEDIHSSRFIKDYAINHLYRDPIGYYVRKDDRGIKKLRLGECRITFFDGKPETYAFSLICLGT